MQALFIGKTDAETLGYDFGIFIAQQAKTYRTSQAAIVAALRPSITPSQPGTSHAPAADTPAPPPAGETTDDAKGLSSLAPASSVEPINEPRPDVAVQTELVRTSAPSPVGSEAVEIPAPIQPSPLPGDSVDGEGIPPNRAPTPSAAFSNRKTQGPIEARLKADVTARRTRLGL